MKGGRPGAPLSLAMYPASPSTHTASAGRLCARCGIAWTAGPGELPLSPLIAFSADRDLSCGVRNGQGRGLQPTAGASAAALEATS